MLKAFLKTVFGYEARGADSGTVVTKHGREIIPYKISIHKYSLGSPAVAYSNLGDFLGQPRALELKEQMKALLTSPSGDRFVLHPDSGDFYLASDIDCVGIERATALGQIDIALEEKLFKLVGERILASKIFNGVSAENPICMDSSGRLYRASNPEETLDRVKLGDPITPSKRIKQPGCDAK